MTTGFYIAGQLTGFTTLADRSPRSFGNGDVSGGEAILPSASISNVIILRGGTWVGKPVRFTAPPSRYRWK